MLNLNNGVFGIDNYSIPDHEVYLNQKKIMFGKLNKAKNITFAE